MAYETLFLWSLALTATLECFAAAILKKTAGRRLDIKCGYGRLLAIVALASILTLPYIWFILPAFAPKGTVFIICSELFAFFLEAAWYILALKINIKQAAILSAAANAFSFLIGLIIIST